MLLHTTYVKRNRTSLDIIESDTIDGPLGDSHPVK